MPCGFQVDAARKTVSKDARYTNEKLPKGNTNFSVRDITLVPEAVAIVEQAKELNPDGEYLFMCHGRT